MRREAIFSVACHHDTHNGQNDIQMASMRILAHWCWQECHSGDPWVPSIMARIPLRVTLWPRVSWVTAIVVDMPIRMVGMSLRVTGMPFRPFWIWPIRLAEVSLSLLLACPFRMVSSGKQRFGNCHSGWRECLPTNSDGIPPHSHYYNREGKWLLEFN